MRFRDRDEFISRTASALFVEELKSRSSSGPVDISNVKAVADIAWATALIFADAKPEETQDETPKGDKECP